MEVKDAIAAVLREKAVDPETSLDVPGTTLTGYDAELFAAIQECLRVCPAEATAQILKRGLNQYRTELTALVVAQAMENNPHLLQMAKLFSQAKAQRETGQSGKQIPETTAQSARKRD